MLDKIEIANFKSIEKLPIDTGLINVFIGENGSGKSSILEALVMAALADSDKLEDDLLESRGVRTTAPELMKSMFDKEGETQPILISIQRTRNSKVYKRDFTITNTNENYAEWEVQRLTSPYINGERTLSIGMESALPIMHLAGKFLIEHDTDNIESTLDDIIKDLDQESYVRNFTQLMKNIMADEEAKDLTLRAYERTSKFNKVMKELFSGLKNFAIYSPQNEQLRDLVRESKLKPLGIYGEGLFKLLNVINKDEPEAYNDIIKGLNLIGWFDDIQLPDDLSENGENLKIKDKYLYAPFNLRSANEGFLYILFYMALIVSKDTPKSFAIDNIDTALNPKLCSKIMSYIAELAKKYGKQIFLTTQNSAVLDGLDLSDDDQRLFVVSRPTKGKHAGRTTVKRLLPKNKPKDIDGKPIPLSEAMLRGYIGGIPKGF